MVNTCALKSKIIENNMTIQSLAPQIGISPYTLGKKISNKVDMGLNEALKIKEILKIRDEEINKYFFAS